jgi:mRNA interferase RelE/StbE
MFAIWFTQAALRDFTTLSREAQRRIRPKIDALAQNPYPHGTKKLKGENAFRIRVGDYRIVYEIRNNELVVLVLRIAHRREAYR